MVQISSFLNIFATHFSYDQDKRRENSGSSVQFIRENPSRYLIFAGDFNSMKEDDSDLGKLESELNVQDIG